MNFEIQITPECLKSLKGLVKRHKSLKQDFKNFADSLKENPFQGVELSQGIRKIRMAITSKGRGKSGGARVITFTVIADENSGNVYIIDIYDKDIYDKADHDTVDLSLLKKIVEDLGL